MVPAELWSRLVDADSYQDLAELLRNSPYGENLAAADPSVVERNLRAHQAAAARALTTSLQGRSREVLAWYSRRFEIENLKAVIRAIHFDLDRDRTAVILLELPAPTLPWRTLVEMGSVSSLVDRLSPTTYGRPLAQARDRYQQENAPFFLEVALDLFYFRRLVRLIGELRGRDRIQGKRFLGRWIAVQNLLWAFRYRDHGGMSPEEIVNYTLHRAFGADIDMVRRIALGSPLAAEAAGLGLDLPHDVEGYEGLHYLERLAARELRGLAEATLARPIFHLGGVLAFLFLLESEISDLTALIEGKLTARSSAELRGYLRREVS
jgi:V/A-type H+-transporting ATPase subunit C